MWEDFNKYNIYLYITIYVNKYNIPGSIIVQLPDMCEILINIYLYINICMLINIIFQVPRIVCLTDNLLLAAVTKDFHDLT